MARARAGLTRSRPDFLRRVIADEPQRPGVGNDTLARVRVAAELRPGAVGDDDELMRTVASR